MAPTASAAASLAMAISVSPNPAAPDSAVSWIGTLTPAGGSLTNLRVHMEFGPGPVAVGTCEPAAYCTVSSGQRVDWNLPSVSSRTTIRYRTAASIGATGQLFLDSEGISCGGTCFPAATLAGPTLSSGLSWTTDGQVVAGAVLRITATGSTNVGPVEGNLHVNLPAGVGAPTNFSSSTAVYSDPPAHYVDNPVTLNLTSTYSFDVVVNAPNGTTMSFSSFFYPNASLPAGQGTLSIKVGPDTVPPSATAPKHSFASGVALASGRLPVRLTWSGSDNQTGVARYDLAQSTDGGAWATVATPTSAAVYQNLAYGRTYRFRVRAIDKAGNTGAWAYGATFRLLGYSEATGVARYTGTWSSVSSTSYWGSKAKAASVAGRNVKFTFTGRSVAWVSLKAPSRGKVAIYVNGVYQATVDLYAASTQAQRVAWAKTWTTSATRVLEVRVLGTAGRPRVDVDGFWVGS